MDAPTLLHHFQADLPLHDVRYKFYVEAATVAVLSYVGFTDFRTFKIRNDSIALLAFLYIVYALIARSPYEILLNVAVSVAVFAALLCFYARGAVGGGDVKLVSVVCLWIGTHCALLFSVLLLLLIGLHVIAVRLGFASTQPMDSRQAIPYAPSIAGALIGTILLGCL
jgi:prepilin peptidase CpaA